MRARTAIAVAGLGSLLLPAAAGAHGSDAPPAPLVRAAAAPAACPGDAIRPDRVITGELGQAEEGSYVMLPFTVPAGTTAVRVKYCYDQPELSTAGPARHTLDLGLYDARRPGTVFGTREFRGWGGSSHPDVTVSPEGFSTEAQYEDDPRGHVPGRTTRAFEPGPIPAGEWGVELGVAAVVSQAEGDLDGRVAWRVEIELARDPAFADEPYRPARYRTAPADRRPGWYAGDMHVHAEHSALGDATMTETFGYAFAPRPQGAGLDFITLSDYVVGSAWGEIGRFQPRHPGKLIARSAEVITYRGHTNNHVSADVVEYRTGPILERSPDGSLVRRRGPRPPSEIFDDVHAGGGFTQVNHPTIFPSEVPLFALLCRGCPWDYSDAETRWEKVDAYEVHTGPAGAPAPSGEEAGPNPFTLTAIEEFDRRRREGRRLTAVAVSDSHNAGSPQNAATQSPIGEGTTVVFADELSEAGLQRAILAGHAFVKLFGADGPDLRLEATPAGGGPTAIMGDRLRTSRARFEARVEGARPSAQPRRLIVLRDGRPVETVPVTGSSLRHEFTADGPGDYRIQLERGTAIEALSNPIRLDPASATDLGGIRLAVSPRRARTGRATRYVLTATTGSGHRRRPLAGATVTLPAAGGAAAGHRSARTDSRGRAVLVRRLRAGTHVARATKPGLAPGRAAVRVSRHRGGPRLTG